MHKGCFFQQNVLLKLKRMSLKHVPGPQLHTCTLINAVLINDVMTIHETKFTLILLDV